jgi:hypothetical protein
MYFPPSREEKQYEALSSVVKEHEPSYNNSNNNEYNF